MTPIEIANNIAENPWAFPGGYPRYALTDHGEALCDACCASEADCIEDSTPGDGWYVVASGINWEDQHLTCGHCNNQIQSAYDCCEEDD